MTVAIVFRRKKEALLALGIIFVVYFCFSSYELLSLSRRKGAEECLQTIPRAANRLLLAQILFQLLLLVIGSVIVIGWNVWRYTHNDLYQPAHGTGGITEFEAHRTAMARLGGSL